MARPTKLTAETHQRVVQLVRGGVFDHVAARAAGIDPATFRRWMERGEREVGPYRTFREDVLRVRAEARASAEARVFAERPFEWLRYGPGRDRAGEPGWTEPLRVEHSGPEGGAIPLAMIDRLLQEAGDAKS